MLKDLSTIAICQEKVKDAFLLLSQRIVSLLTVSAAAYDHI